MCYGFFEVVWQYVNCMWRVDESVWLVRKLYAV